MSKEKFFEFLSYSLPALMVVSVGVVVWALLSRNILVGSLAFLIFGSILFGETRGRWLTRLWHKAGKKCWWEGGNSSKEEK